MKMKEKSEKFSLNLNNQNTKIRTSSPITSWQIETMGTVTGFILGSPKSLHMVIIAMNLKDPGTLEEKL